MQQITTLFPHPLPIKNWATSVLKILALNKEKRVMQKEGE